MMTKKLSYGAAFADVYDEWYGTSDDLGDVLALLTESNPRRVLELGVGTGRVAIPLGRRLLETCRSAADSASSATIVVGVDESPEMLSRLAENDLNDVVHVVQGDMVDDQPDGEFDLVFVSYNTLFNLVDRARQRQCIANAASRLGNNGLFILDACVIDTEAHVGAHDPAHGSSSVQRGDWHVHTETIFDTASGRITGTITSNHADGRVAVRPFSITYSPPEEIDAMCASAVLTRVARYGSWKKTDFSDLSARHVSVYRNLR
ncbi:MAG: hypothetical protein RL072_483 [Actinomycetota bacterium]|jgi:SAM-dependent methyltransferase